MASHPKHAIAKPKKLLQEAEDALTEARIELTKANAEVRDLQIKNADALMLWIKSTPPVDKDTLLRDLIARETAAKMANVKAGKPPVEVKEVQYVSAIDAAFGGARAKSPDSRTARPKARPLMRGR